MKYSLILFIMIIALVACNHPASVEAPTQPALNFPALSADSLPLCKADELQTSSNYNEDPEKVIFLGVTLINISKYPCALSNPPHISLLDNAKKSLGINSVKSTFIQALPAPSFVQLVPNESVIVSIIWKNYCQSQPGEDLTIQFTLAQDQTIDVRMKVLAKPGCTAKNEPSTISVSPFSVPP